jgi:hypothetical protein
MIIMQIVPQVALHTFVHGHVSVCVCVCVHVRADCSDRAAKASAALDLSNSVL